MTKSLTGLITFYERFSADIKSNKKTITIRNLAEANYQAGQIVEAKTYPESEPITFLQILNVTPVVLSDLNEEHARQENMSLEVLVPLIQEIYPNESQFFVIEFKQVKQE